MPYWQMCLSVLLTVWINNIISNCYLAWQRAGSPSFRPTHSPFLSDLVCFAQMLPNLVCRLPMKKGYKILYPLCIDPHILSMTLAILFLASTSLVPGPLTRWLYHFTWGHVSSGRECPANLPSHPPIKQFFPACHNSEYPWLLCVSSCLSPANTHQSWPALDHAQPFFLLCLGT